MRKAVRLYVRIAGIDQPSVSCNDEPSSRALTMLPGRLTTPRSPVTEEMLSFKEPLLRFST